eukprot:15432220-Alexandrium_andersonii.AAC.1
MSSGSEPAPELRDTTFGEPRSCAVSPGVATNHTRTPLRPLACATLLTPRATCPRRDGKSPSVPGMTLNCQASQA